MVWQKTHFNRSASMDGSNRPPPKRILDPETATATDEVFFQRQKMMIPKYNSVLNAKDPSESRIPKVPSMLRENKEFQKYFEPRLVSIGPYHHCNVKLKPAETLKLKFTKDFVNGRRDRMDDLYVEIFKEIKKWRNCYDEKPTDEYNDEALAWMLFVDGCTVLHYIDCRVRDRRQHLKIKDHHVAFFDQDLFLLENQLPFEVLKLLMESIPTTMKLIEAFIKKHLETKRSEKVLKHRWWQLLGQQQQQQQQQPPPPSPSHRLDLLPSASASHLLDLLRKRFICNGSDNDIKDEDNGSDNDIKDEDNWHSFRNVIELKSAGIHLKPNDSYETDRLTAVSFRSHCCTGDLKLPLIVVDDSTKPRFLNLIAYEMSSGDIQSEVTSYICFLDSIIDHPDDVKELRKEGILHNFLGSDEEVAKLFNEISTDLVPNPRIYKDVKVKIQKHYDSKFKCWMAQFKHDHFSSPWTILAFIGALLAILLTSVQTYFAISPRPS